MLFQATLLLWSNSQLGPYFEIQATEGKHKENATSGGVFTNVEPVDTRDTARILLPVVELVSLRGLACVAAWKACQNHQKQAIFIRNHPKPQL